MSRRVLEEKSFHDTICLERKRAERSRKSFLLVLLNLGQLLVDDDNRDSAIRKILSSLATATRETDVTGWYKSGAVLGVMFTEVPTESRTLIASVMISRASGALYNNLSFGQFNQIAISHYLFPEEWDCEVPQRPSSPTLYPDLEKRDRGSKLYFITKRVVDIVGSGCGLLICAPLFLLIALALRLSSKGPVFFRQQRIGQFGTPFVFLKFRSMYVNNNPRIHREYVTKLISGQAQLQTDSGNGRGVYKLTQDPRVTRVGAFLRKTSLDELPQLWNVLRGEMSLVGPRPAISYEVEAYQTWHRRRVLEAKPGITGLWQVSGRSRLSFDDMVRLDVRYAMKRSFWLDMRILLNTPLAVLRGEGAY
jgi:lipopolysaccharide/colanic/teichoic acid biosynthesis glycosyltransferase